MFWKGGSGVGKATDRLSVALWSDNASVVIIYVVSIISSALVVIFISKGGMKHLERGLPQ